MNSSKSGLGLGAVRHSFYLILIGMGPERRLFGTLSQNPAIPGYATEDPLFISGHLSTDVVVSRFGLGVKR